MKGYEPSPLAEGIRTQIGSGDSKGCKEDGYEVTVVSRRRVVNLAGGIRTQGDCGDSKAGGKSLVALEGYEPKDCGDSKPGGKSWRDTNPWLEGYEPNG